MDISKKNNYAKNMSLYEPYETYESYENNTYNQFEQITFKSMDASIEQKNCSVDLAQNIAQTIPQIKALFGFTKCELKLIFNGAVLTDMSKTFLDYDIKANSTILVIKNVRKFIIPQLVQTEEQVKNEIVHKINDIHQNVALSNQPNDIQQFEQKECVPNQQKITRSTFILNQHNNEPSKYSINEFHSILPIIFAKFNNMISLNDYKKICDDLLTSKEFITQTIDKLGHLSFKQNEHESLKQFEKNLLNINESLPSTKDKVLPSTKDELLLNATKDKLTNTTKDKLINTTKDDLLLNTLAIESNSKPLFNTTNNEHKKQKYSYNKINHLNDWSSKSKLNSSEEPQSEKKPSNSLSNTRNNAYKNHKHSHKKTIHLNECLKKELLPQKETIVSDISDENTNDNLEVDFSAPEKVIEEPNKSKQIVEKKNPLVQSNNDPSYQSNIKQLMDITGLSIEIVTQFYEKNNKDIDTTTNMLLELIG